MIRSLPNLLTLSRIIVIPVFIVAFYLPSPLSHWIASTLFLIASITDFIDGYLARAWKVQSNLGRFLDPIADKLLVATAIMLLTYFDGVGKYDLIPAIAIVCREILVSGLREFLAELKEKLPVSKLGKVKTAVQMTALYLLILGSDGSGIAITDLLGRISLWIAALLTLQSGYIYLRAGLKHMSFDGSESP